ncbi:TlpA family protein disulfide reductase [Kaarinaea lacus]
MADKSAMEMIRLNSSMRHASSTRGMRRVTLAFLGICIFVSEYGFANETGRRLTEFPYKPHMPVLVLPDTKGQAIDIKQLNQKVVVVNFWASWCPSCVSELQVMHNTATTLADKDVAVLAVNVGDNINIVSHYFSDFTPAFQVLLDERSQTTRDWQIMGLPTTYVIGPDRRIHYGAIGVLAWESEQVMQTILRLRSIHSESSQ